MRGQRATSRSPCIKLRWLLSYMNLLQGLGIVAKDKDNDPIRCRMQDILVVSGWPLGSVFPVEDGCDKDVDGVWNEDRGEHKVDEHDGVEGSDPVGHATGVEIRFHRSPTHVE